MESVSSGLTGDTASYSPVPRAVRIDSTKLRQRNNKTVMSNSNNSYSNSYDHYNSNSNGNGDSISYSNGNSSSRHSDSQSTEYIDGNGHSNSYTHNSTTYSHSDSYSNQDDNYSNSQDNSYPSRATNNSEIQDMSAMLGREKFSKFQAEEYCGACGLLHNRPELLDMYNFCRSCYSILRDPNHLRY